MGAGKVFHMDVVAHGGAVGGVVVRAIEVDGIAPAGGSLEHEGNQVGLWTVVFALLAAGPGDVEVAHADGGQTVRRRLEAEHLVHGQLGGTIGAQPDGRRVLGDRHAVGYAIHGGGGRED